LKYREKTGYLSQVSLYALIADKPCLVLNVGEDHLVDNAEYSVKECAEQYFPSQLGNGLFEKIVPEGRFLGAIPEPEGKGKHFRCLVDYHGFPMESFPKIDIIICLLLAHYNCNVWY
jgi:hypothetical protein